MSFQRLAMTLVSSPTAISFAVGPPKRSKWTTNATTKTTRAAVKIQNAVLDTTGFSFSRIRAQNAFAEDGWRGEREEKDPKRRGGLSPK